MGLHPYHSRIIFKFPMVVALTRSSPPRAGASLTPSARWTCGDSSAARMNMSRAVSGKPWRRRAGRIGCHRRTEEGFSIAWVDSRQFFSRATVQGTGICRGGRVIGSDGRRVFSRIAGKSAEVPLPAQVCPVCARISSWTSSSLSKPVPTVRTLSLLIVAVLVPVGPGWP